MPVCNAVPSTLIFLHIPKAAGSTLHRILNRCYPKEAIHNVSVGELSDAGVAELTSTDLSRIRVLKGHQPFGLHTYLPGRARYISLVREPVSRIVSRYNYILRMHGPQRAAILENGWSCADWVQRGSAPGTNNGQVRWLTGTVKGQDADDASLLELAIQHIEQHFLLIGPSERFDEFLVGLAALLGWKGAPVYRRLNQAPEPAVPLSQTERERILAHNRLDSALYSYICQWFDRAIGQLPGFEEHRRRFLQRQKAHQLLVDPSSYLRRLRKFIPRPASHLPSPNLEPARISRPDVQVVQVEVGVLSESTVRPAEKVQVP